MARYVFHIDVNSAYLSWTAVDKLHNGDPVDLRQIAAVVGGSEKSRHGIVLAKSTLAKQHGILTGEPLLSARQKCPGLLTVPPDYRLYMKASNAMLELIREYSPKVQQFSIDECFVDYLTEGQKQTDPVALAHEIKDRIHHELGFTVNIGISVNKILAKMASDFKKPNNVHTLFQKELPEKLWPLPVGDLFMVGRKTEAKLRNIGIETIGELANFDTGILFSHLKSYAYLIQNYANGIDESPIRKGNHELVKGMGNSTTSRFDVTETKDAYMILLSLSESVGMRLRAADFCCGLIAVSITSTEFTTSSRQRKLDVAMNSTSYIHMITKELFDDLWNGSPVRKLGVRVSDLQSSDYVQMSFLENYDFEKNKSIDSAVDRIRGKYGTGAIYRASFLHSGHKPLTGGIGEDDYPVMTSIL